MPTYSKLKGVLAEDRVKAAEIQVILARQEALHLIERANIRPGEHEMRDVSKLAKAYKSRKMTTEFHKLRAYLDASSELYSAKESLKVWEGRISPPGDGDIPKTHKKEKPWRADGVDVHTVKDSDMDNARNALVSAEADAEKAAEECKSVLLLTGNRHAPQNWKYARLRALARNLTDDGQSDDAKAVSRYADARIAVNHARGEVHRIRALICKAEERRSRKLPEPVHIDPVTSQAVPARLVMATPQDESPVRLVGYRSRSHRTVWRTPKQTGLE